jgi:hypothetical protein
MTLLIDTVSKSVSIAPSCKQLHQSISSWQHRNYSLSFHRTHHSITLSQLPTLLGLYVSFLVAETVSPYPQDLTSSDNTFQSVYIKQSQKGRFWHHDTLE